MKLFYKKIKKLNDGFTLVETLVAISIFSMSIIVLMSVLGGGISDISYAKKKMTAGYLAQEGIEYVRNMRDNYVLYTATTPYNWDEFKGFIPDRISYPSDDTNFTRTITLEEITPDEVKVSSEVKWIQASGEIKITLTENLFNWVEL